MTAHNVNDHALGNTAFWTAAVRALEHERPDHLFSDPWAQALAGEVGAAWIAQRTAESVVPIILRTRYFDDFLLRIAEQENIRQVVMLAAGLDTRAYRLAWPEGMRFFELDQEAVLGYKAHILGMAGASPAGELQRIAVDLTGDWQAALLKSGFDPAQPAAWLLEGFLFYISTESLVRILDEVCQAFLAQRGWKPNVTQAGAPEANHGRWTLPVLPVLMPGMPHNWYVTAQKE